MSRPNIQKNYLNKDPLLIEGFSSVGSFSTVGCTGIYAVNDPGVSSNFNSTSIRLYQETSAQSTQITKVLSSSVDLTDYDCLVVLVYSRSVPKGNNFTLYIENSSVLNTFGNYMTATCGGTLTGTPSRGWNCFVIRKTSFSVGAGTLQWNNVNQIRLKFTPTTGPDEYIINGIWATKRAVPSVMLTCDDGSISQYAAATEANTYGLKTHHALVPALVESGGGATYLSKANITTLLNAGNTVGTHGWDHTSFISQSDYGANDIKRQLDWLNSNSFSNRGLLHHQWVQGEYNPGTIQAIQNVGMLSAGSVLGTSYSAGPPERYEATTSCEQTGTSFGLLNPYSYSRITLASGATTLVQAKQYVDTAILRGTSIAFYGHTFSATPGATDVDTATWTGLLQYIYAKVKSGLIINVLPHTWYQTFATGRVIS